MLKYFTDSAELLMAAAIIVGFTLSYSAAAYGRKGKLIAALGLLAGVTEAVWFAHTRNSTNRISIIVAAKYNIATIRAFCWAGVVFLGLGLVLLLPWGRKLSEKTVETDGIKETVQVRTPLGWLRFGLETAAALALAMVTTSLIFYMLPNVLNYPYDIYMVEKTVVSTEFILKLLGVIFAVIFAVLLSLAVNRAGARLPRWAQFVLTGAALTIYGYRLMMTAVRHMVSQRMIKADHELFVKITNVYNNSRWYTYACIVIAALVFVGLWVMSFIQKDPYTNPAEKRKVCFKWKVIRRWANFVFCCLVMCVVTLTVLYNIANKVVELSPVEEVKEQNGNICIPFSDVDDGHLHRFGWTSPSGREIRFIAIKKPNSSAYGIGLDACDICGETGYYERDGQVVCKLCDVVMNINSIGFKGGCNPIVIPWSISDGQIVVPTDGLLEHEKEFKAK